MKGVFDFFGMVIAGASFLSGIYLVFIKELMVIAILLLAIAFAMAAVVSCFDLVIEEKYQKINRRKRNGNKEHDLGQRRVS